MDGAVIINGLWGSDRIECCLINIYAPCPLPERVRLWDRIHQVIVQNAVSCICVAGDFNSIRREFERVGRRSEFARNDVEAFDEFIVNAGLIDLPLHGRFYTCYRPDGTFKSRLDRILINNNWLSR